MLFSANICYFQQHFIAFVGKKISNTRFFYW
jgi:hypothetical protein